MKRQHWQDWVVALAGVWLIASLWVVTYSLPEGMTTTALTWNFALSGAAALILGAAALFSYRFWEEWVDIVLGVWIVISPWVLQFANSTSATWNAVVCGAVIIVAAGWTLFEERQAAQHA
ncbi:SPW repeat protein [Consotaella salsifontis]|uniref:SPW repeat-containing protein n=1 Tax=Consotaella salsifontis TaxID=1365950 RepID=A0A1T4TFD5_9HYPH|nr:SPW repeat protein [Consotaella salsifontis]SKA39193.1 SPW repeat-containing protein [Consotaella salsifontis]